MLGLTKVMAQVNRDKKNSFIWTESWRVRGGGPEIAHELKSRD